MVITFLLSRNKELQNKHLSTLNITFAANMALIYHRSINQSINLFAEEKCNVQLTSEDIIQTPNFPYYYGMDLSCEWVITAPIGYFVALNTSEFALAGMVKPIKVSHLKVHYALN